MARKVKAAWWRRRRDTWGDRELFWTMLVLVALVVWTANVFAAEVPAGPGDWGFDSLIVGKDGPRDVQQKLGTAPCLVPSESGETMSYLYHVAGAHDPFFVRLEMNGHLDAITLSKDPPIAGVCYAPAHLSGPVRTGRGLQLGASTEDVTKLYGRPTENFTVGALARFRYVVMYDRRYEWDLVFRNGHLVEWTVLTQE